MFKRILVAVDGSPTSSRGFKAALDLAQGERATVDILHVVDDLAMVPYVSVGDYIPAQYIDTFLTELRDSGRKVLAKAKQLASESGVSANAVLVEAKGSTVAHTILRQARKLHSDVIVLGTHGRRGLRRVLLGSDAEAVLRESRVPVLLVRAPERAKNPVRKPVPLRRIAETAAKRARGPGAKQMGILALR